MADNNLVQEAQFENPNIFARVNPALDPFGRNRVSFPKTIFDSKLNIASHPLFWNDTEIAGAGTTSVYSLAASSYTMSVSADTAGTRVRQSKQRMNYQPGKGQFFAGSVVLGEGAAGITRRIGLFDQANGVFFELSGTTMKVVVRSSVSGSPVDNAVDQADWEYEKLQGSWPAKVTLDSSKTLIFVIDFESLQVGSVRYGVYLDGLLIYTHAIDHANLIDEPYFSTPNLPVRYELSNDGTGPAASMKVICNTVISEGGSEETGITSYITTGTTSVAAAVAGTTYAVLGIRLKSTALDNVVKLAKISMSCLTNDRFEWAIVLNPTVAGTFTYNDRPNSALQFAIGATENTVTGGVEIDGAHSESSSAISEVIESLYYLGSTTEGVSDEMVLVARPESNNATLKGSITAKEIA